MATKQEETTKENVETPQKETYFLPKTEEVVIR